MVAEIVAAVAELLIPSPAQVALALNMEHLPPGAAAAEHHVVLYNTRRRDYHLVGLPE